MRLRIARKMDRGDWRRRRLDDKDRRPWWSVYSDAQLERALRRLRSSWLRRSPVVDGGRSVTPDFFRSNRVESRLIRQRALRRARRAS